MRLGPGERGAIEAALRHAAEADGGRPPAVWLRDDDAVAPSPALDRLLEIAAGAGMPVSLAVIPAKAGPALAGHLAGRPGIAVLQHGYAHLDHSGGSGKKREFGPDRPLVEMTGEIADGARRLAAFPNVLPVFVPPWNRIDEALAGALAPAGFAALSAFGDRAAAEAAPGLLAVNAHIDPVDWRGGRGFLGAPVVTERLLARLARLAAGEADRAEPTGLLTHHLVHDAQTFAFLEDLLQFLAIGGLCRFVSSPMWLKEAARVDKTGTE